MLTRRDVVVAGALLILSIDGKASCCRAQSARAPRSRGCHLADADLAAIYPIGKATARFAAETSRSSTNPATPISISPWRKRWPRSPIDWG